MDRRIQKTRQAIREAYFALLTEGGQKRISVAEIARLANIDRKTFYLHFETPEDILREFLNDRIQELTKRLRNAGYFEEPLHMEKIFDALTELLQQDMELYRALASQETMRYFIERVRMLMEDALIRVYAGIAAVPEPEFRVYCGFFTAGLIQVYLDFLRSSRQITAGQLGTIVADIAVHGASGIFVGMSAMDTAPNKE